MFYDVFSLTLPELNHSNKHTGKYVLSTLTFELNLIFLHYFSNGKFYLLLLLLNELIVILRHLMMYFSVLI